MKSGLELEIHLKKIKPELSAKFFVDKIGYFGSFSRNEQTETSDIDILVNFSKTPGWEFFDLKDFLEIELQRKVDLVTVNALKSQLKSSILQEVKYV